VTVTMPHSPAALQGVVVEASGMADRLEEVLFRCQRQHAKGMIASQHG
jgi:hypothetical protein